jgi:cell division transport system ATP-binding protein
MGGGRAPGEDRTSVAPDPGGAIPMILVHRVSKLYPGGVPALHEIDLTVERGEFVFLTGPSGAGKTTLLRILLRQEAPTAGQVFVNGRNVGGLPLSQVPAMRRAIGVVFQDFKLISRKTALENVAYVLNVAGVSRAEQKERAYAALKGVGLQHRAAALPATLSGGEQQRVAIARAVVHEPDLLLADEPTGNLDPDLGVEVMRLFREINARGTTIVVATHDRDLIQRMARRTIVLERGTIASAERATA